jgi:hypothetical protein
MMAELDHFVKENSLGRREQVNYLRIIERFNCAAMPEILPPREIP